jgi:hypothetical protein
MSDEAKEIAKALRADGMRCNCDLDNWEPEQKTGHSHVCRIHKATLAKLRAIYLNNKGMR